MSGGICQGTRWEDYGGYYKGMGPTLSKISSVNGSDWVAPLYGGNDFQGDHLDPKSIYHNKQVCPVN